MTRRELLKLTLLSVPALMSLQPGEVLASLPKSHYSGQLSFLNQHTKEFLSVQYMGSNGLLDFVACERLNHLFRCAHSGEILAIDTKLFVLLDAVRCRLGARERPFVLLSGYRSPDYNRMLKRRDRHVGRNSFHTKGMAADIKIDGVWVRDIAKVAKSFEAGGIGRYSDFVHVDVGPLRYW